MQYSTTQPKFEITAIPAFSDNYIWLLRYGSSAVVVDPGDAIPVIETLKKLSLTLTGILITHHHSDHIGGVQQLLEYQKVPVYAPKHETYDFPHIAVDEHDEVILSEINEKFTVLSLPGHTLGHIAYVNESRLFCGDTLFGAGCGRLFEGTPAQMYHSLQRLAKLPGDIQVYCTHEYTEHNIKFALTLEPDNQDLVQRQIEAHDLRAQNLPTLPSSIELELKTNPFLRCNQAAILANSQTLSRDALSVFTKIREMRNHY